VIQRGRGKNSSHMSVRTGGARYPSTGGIHYYIKKKKLGPRAIRRTIGKIRPKAGHTGGLKYPVPTERGGALLTRLEKNPEVYVRQITRPSEA